MAKFLQADNEDSNQTALMQRIICVFVVYMSEGIFSHVETIYDKYLVQKAGAQNWSKFLTHCSV